MDLGRRPVNVLKCPAVLANEVMPQIEVAGGGIWIVDGWVIPRDAVESLFQVWCNVVAHPELLERGVREVKYGSRVGSAPRRLGRLAVRIDLPLEPVRMMSLQPGERRWSTLGTFSVDPDIRAVPLSPRDVVIMSGGTSMGLRGIGSPYVAYVRGHFVSHNQWRRNLVVEDKRGRDAGGLDAGNGRGNKRRDWWGRCGNLAGALY
jgi:hypothetical protein